MKRFKTIDTLRGISIVWMIIGHLTEWWILNEELWFFNILRSIGDPLGSGAFLFIAGVSTALSYKKNIQERETHRIKMYRRAYFLRAFIIFVIALIYNALISIKMNNPADIWTWFILLTVSVSLFLGWPLLKTSKRFRIYLGLTLWVINLFLMNYLLNFSGQMNFLGILNHLLYNRLGLDPILSFFTFFIIGTVIGEVTFEIYLIEDRKERRFILKKKLLIPGLIVGMLLIIFGIFFRFPNFLHHRTFSWLFYSLGILLILMSSLIFIEEIEVFRFKKNYKFLYYFSYYSLSIYLLHNVLFFIFQNSLQHVYLLMYISITLFLLGILLRIIHIKIGPHFSIKIQIGRLSRALAKRL
ncbi:MAG: heparan-alpha-glucosaminide N-acetyltransferase domain-containing protein [Promethearchaeota archaeon]